VGLQKDDLKIGKLNVVTSQLRWAR